MNLIPTVQDTAEQHDKSEIVIPAKTELKLVGSIKPHKGHTCYQFDLATKTITPAVFEEVNTSYPLNKAAAKHMQKLPVRKKLIIQPNCIYCTALNVPNAIRRFVKMLQLNHASKHYTQSTQDGQDGEHPAADVGTEH